MNGKKQLRECEDGLIWRMIIRLWIQILWNLFGGYLKIFMIND
jgi:hypothetical protein